MKLTEELKGMESRVAGVQALAQNRADRWQEEGSRYRHNEDNGQETIRKQFPAAYKAENIELYHIEKRCLLHLI